MSIRHLSNGKVEITWDDGAFYRGDYINNTITGQGYLKYATGKEYTGDFKNAEWDGWGKAVFYGDTHSEYEGYWIRNRREGEGKTVFYSNSGEISSIWEGTYHNDILDGEGVCTYKDGTQVKGRFHGWEPVGDVRIWFGASYEKDGLYQAVYEGSVITINGNPALDGQGKLTYPDGTAYIGEFYRGKMSGAFEIIYPDGREDSKFLTDYPDPEAADSSDSSAKGETAITEKETEHADAAPFEKDTSRYLSARETSAGAYSEKINEYFNGVIGMASVKEQLDKMYKRFSIDRMRAEALGIRQGKQGYYFIITGNPGTGKTTVARIIAKILYDLRILPNDRLIEVDRAGLVGQYIGQTAIKTNEVIQQARGGTLFIDEAYTLYRKDDDKDFGKEAIDTLLKDMEDHRGEYAVILAGYKLEMGEMIRSANPGLSSRFDHKLHIEDYTADEIADILIVMADAKRFLIEKEAYQTILSRIDREKVDETFDNARFARRLLDEAIERQAVRLSEMTGSLSKEDLQVLKAEDFGRIQTDLSTLDSCMQKLNDLIGLQGVKDEVNSLVRAIRIRNESLKRGLSIADNQLSLNMVFTGNPGTGKTTVARLLSQIYYHMGVLKRPDVFVECVRADLVGRYQGETAIKVKDAVRRALGGILFIDEAYSLVMNDQDSFGIEAVNTLVSEIENNRDKLAVILAGYTNEMNAFLDANPGLRSRLPKRIEFADYTAEELCRIFRKTLEGRGYQVRVTEGKLLSVIRREMTAKDFGNARGVRNICDRTVAKQNERINQMDFSALTNEAILTISDEDLV